MLPILRSALLSLLFLSPVLVAAEEFVKPVVDAKPAATKKKAYSAILVDKATNTLELTDLQAGEYVVVKKFHATLGKTKGDKAQEGDQKTPEGIYTFKALLKPPGLPAKFGHMAFYVNYPNDFDRIAGRTGYGIMLHATDTPTRLNENYDSEGCVVCNNDELAEIAPYIRLGLTPILIFDKLTDEYRKPGTDPSIQSFFESWIKAWEARDIDAYIGHYHSDFVAQKKDRDQWKKYKAALNTRYVDI